MSKLAICVFVGVATYYLKKKKFTEKNSDIYDLLVTATTTFDAIVADRSRVVLALFLTICHIFFTKNSNDQLFRINVQIANNVR